MSTHTSISQSINYIEAHLTAEATIERAAAAAGYSRHHFSRTFLAMTGLTPTSYLRKRRLSEAARELVTSSQRILDIALDYQFGSQEAFTRSFRGEFGVNPGRYRQQGRLQQLWGAISLGVTNLLYPGQGISHAPKLFIPEAKVVEAVLKPRPNSGRIPELLNFTLCENRISQSGNTQNTNAGFRHNRTVAPTPTGYDVEFTTSEPVSIRQAHRQDIPALCRLYYELHEFTTSGIFQPNSPQRLQSLGNHECFDATALTLSLRKRLDTLDVAIFVADLRGQVVGLAEVYLRKDGPNEVMPGIRYGYLQSLVVMERMRGLGLGKQLLQAAESWSREQGGVELRLDTWEFEEGPLYFYERQGYRTLRRTLVRSL